MSLYGIITARKRSLGQGNILSSVCQGLCPQGGGLVPGVPGVGKESGPGGCLVGGGSRPTPKGEVEGDLVPPMTATAAGRTHPTGMHSCFCM